MCSVGDELVLFWKNASFFPVRSASTAAALTRDYGVKTQPSRCRVIARRRAESRRRRRRRLMAWRRIRSVDHGGFTAPHEPRGEKTAGAGAHWMFIRMMLEQVWVRLLPFADPDTDSTEPNSEKYHSRRDTGGNLGSLPCGRRLSVGCGSLRAPLPASLLGPSRRFEVVAKYFLLFFADTLCFGVLNNQLWL